MLSHHFSRWKLFPKFRTFRYYTSNNFQNFKISEVQIPFKKSDTSYIAGKLWECPQPGSDNRQSYLPLICIHGYLDNAASFDTLIPLILKPNMQIFAFDLLGHGLSSHTAFNFYEHYLEGFISLHRILQHFNWEKATFMGHSLGAQMLFPFASIYPELVDRYIALDNFRPIFRDARHYVQINLHKYFDVEEKLTSGIEPPSYPWDEILQRTYIGREKSINLEECKLLLKRGAKQIENGNFQFTHDIRSTIPTMYGRFSKDQSAAFAKNLKCPICVIKGEPGVDYEPREYFMENIDLVRQYAERVEFHLVPGSHHFFLNHPHLVAPIVNAFLES